MPIKGTSLTRQPLAGIGHFKKGGYTMSKSMLTLIAILLMAVVTVAAPPMPNDAQIVQPDPSLPKELAAFSGKWEGIDFSFGQKIEFFLIVEKIDKEKASLYCWPAVISGGTGTGWQRYDAQVTKERGKYILWFRGRTATNELSLKGEKLQLFVPPRAVVIFTRVPL